MRRARTRLVALPAAVALLAGCGAGGGSSTTTGGDLDERPNPLAGKRLYLDPDGAAVEQVETWRRESRNIDAARLQPIARQPVATWFAGQQEDPFQAARDLAEPAAAAGQVPVLVLYDIPGRDCGLYSAGGAADIDAYLEWVGSLAAGLDGREAVVVLEPDAVAQAVDGCGGDDGPDRAERYRTLEQAVAILERQEGVSTYVDAGNATWVEDVDAMVEALRASGVEQADGFALNVANFQTTQASAEYGHDLSDRLGGAHFVIDTSRNGAGPPDRSDAVGEDDHASWCNPASARIGEPPTTDAGLDRVDALLWVKPPGNSDGECRDGAPEAGAWWPEYALQLVG